MKNLTPGEILRARRKALKMTLRDVGRIAKISVAYVVLIEQGKRNCPALKVLWRLAYAYGFSFHDIVDIFMRNNECITDSKYLSRMS